MFIEGLVDNTNKRSVASTLRQKRFALFLQLIKDLPRPVRVLDVGGRLKYWQMIGFTDPEEIHVTLLNIENISSDGHDNFVSLQGDARHMPQFADNSFDIVFSNSVIEHVGDLEDQHAMAKEVQRVSNRYYVQTPNYYFPMEPHFLVPFFQMMPREVRARLHANFNLGWHKKTGCIKKARENIAFFRLMKRRELEEMFPQGKIYEEKFAGMVKSFVVYS